MFSTIKNTKNSLSRIFTFSQAFLLATAASLSMQTNANATDVVNIQYKNTEIAVKVKDLKKFANTGEIPQNLQKFLNDTEQVPEFLSGILNQEIYISRSLIDDVLDSTTGKFFLLKLNQAIGASSSTDDLEAIKKTVVKAYNDDQELSLLELLSDYPQRQLTVDLTRLESTYDDANQFVDSILPAWEVAKSFLEDVVCDCEAE